MPSSVNRVGRAVQLVLRPLRSVGFFGKLVLGLLALAGVSAVAVWRKALLAWVESDWAHLALLAAMAAAVLCFLAVLSVLKERDELAVVRVGMEPLPTPPTLHAIVQRSTSEELRDVLHARVALRFRNPSSLSGAAFYPRVELWSRRTRFSRWRNVPIERIHPSGTWKLQGGRVSDLWHAKKRAEIPSRDVVEAELGFLLVAPQDIGVFDEHQVELRVTVDVLGQDEQTFRIPLRSIERISVPLKTL